MVKKIYFPRLYLPLTIVLRSLFDAGVATIFLFLVMWQQGVSWSVVGGVGYGLALVLLALFTSGLSFGLSSFNARYRDFRHLIPFVIQIWFYITPVFYAADFLGGKLAILLKLNPVAGMIELGRVAIFAQTIDWWQMGMLLVVDIGVLILGAGIFKKWETEMVDWT
jgi:ABC-type polysaccharide/polyol phosphate export permease